MSWVSFENKNQADCFLDSLYQNNCEIANFAHDTRSDKDIYVTPGEANLLSQHIRFFYEKGIIKDVYNKRFYGLSQVSETNRIYELSEKIAKNDMAVDTALLSDILQLMENSKQVVVRGATDFSLFKYKKALEEIVERGIEEYAIERERKSFIDLLRYFVSLQSTVHRMIHVVNDGGFYRVLDEQYSEIHFYSGAGAYDDLFTDISSEEDWVLSLLITIAPDRIVLHDRMKNTPESFVETLMAVFENRIKLCYGCSQCENNT